MAKQPSPVVLSKPGGRGFCEVDWCRCVRWKGGGRGMSGLETCSCGHLAQVHEFTDEQQREQSAARVDAERPF